MKKQSQASNIIEINNKYYLIKSYEFEENRNKFFGIDGSKFFLFIYSFNVSFFN